MAMHPQVRVTTAQDGHVARHSSYDLNLTVIQQALLQHAHALQPDVAPADRLVAISRSGVCMCTAGCCMLVSLATEHPDGGITVCNDWGTHLLLASLQQGLKLSDDSIIVAITTITHVCFLT